VLAATSALPRRSAANMAMFGAVVTLALSLLVAWGMTRKSAAFQATYPYLNFPVAFTGPSNFQGFGIDIVLHVDRLTSVAILVVELCVIAGLAWHRVMGRSEPGGARFYALVSVLLFAAVGALVSYDLAELFAFWGLAGATTYLMLSQRWGSDEASRSGRIALALPFASDLSLLCGIGILYSRYGAQSITGLLPVLHTTLGVGQKSLTAASILLFIGVAGRLAVWPLQSWLTSTARTSPAAASAMAQSVWSVVAIVVLLRIMPFIAASNVQTLRYLVYACGVAAVAAPLLALFGNDPRRAIVLIGSGAAAVGAGLVVHAYEISSFTYAMFGIACVLAAAPARAAATMAASSLAAMRTDDMAEMGDGLRRMRGSTIAVLVSVLVIASSAAVATAFGAGTRARFALVIGEAVLLVSIGGIRVFLAAGIGPLRRRRAFEPDRVRDAPADALAWPYWLALLGVVITIATLFPSWIGYLDSQKHKAGSAEAVVVWVAVAAIGVALTAAAYAFDKDGALRASAGLGRLLDWLVSRALAALDRFIYSPLAALTVRVSEWVPRGDGQLARASAASGRLALWAARAPAVPLLIAIAAVLAIAIGLASPGLFR
jgi:NADH:ubiquinone oxidoreductase subunit 5 (subunit L)/multisubunit Na+/H+ antiporter MnhA subunit